MPQIALSDACDANLKTLITDFGQTREDVINRLIDEEFARKAAAANGGVAAVPVVPAVEVNISVKPSAAVGLLAHTKLLVATVGGVELHKPKWNGLREYVHVLAAKQVGGLAELKKISDANLKSGKYTGEGYKHLPEVGFSIQGVDANAAWDDTFKLVKALNLPVRIEFVWREKDGAAHPGKVGVIEWPGEKSRAA